MRILGEYFIQYHSIEKYANNKYFNIRNLLIKKWIQIYLVDEWRLNVKPIIDLKGGENMLLIDEGEKGQ